MKPILFNTQMVQAILEGRKTVTRRVMKIQPWDCSDIGCKEHNVYNFFKDEPYEFACKICGCGVGPSGDSLFKAYVKTGDILYVRETFHKTQHENYPYFYKTDKIDMINVKWSPSLHMPKEAARLFLKVTDVKVERLQDISEEQALKEGIVRTFDHMSEEAYKRWAHGITELKQCEHPFENYLWHGNFNCGSGSKTCDAWKYQYSGYPNPRDSFSSLWNTTVKMNEWDKFGWDANPWVWVIEFEPISKEKAYGN